MRALAKEERNKGFFRQLFEMALLFLRSRLGPGYYLLAQMYRRDASLAEVLGYLSVRQYNKRVFKLNNRLYHRSSQNKVIEKAVLTAYGQPTPELLGHYREVSGFTTTGAPLRTGAELKGLLNQQAPGSRLCFKLTEAWGGEGFRAIECLENDLIRDLSSQEAVSVDAFVSSVSPGAKAGILIERYLEQHADYASYNRSSVNTLRVLVVRKANDTVVCVGAFLRVGGTGSLVDNMTAGGLSYPIDLDTGVLKAGLHKYKLGDSYDRNPEKNLTMTGIRLPMFEEAIELARSSLLAFPETRFVGADIAVSKDGPVVLELNIQPDYNGFAYIRCPSRAALSLT